MAPSWAIPVGTLAGLCAAAMIFVCWWFPRTWRKGVAQEMKDLEATRAQVAMNDLEGGRGVVVEMDENGNSVSMERKKITFEEALERARADIRAGRGNARVVY